jgi:hypothetical protein
LIINIISDTIAIILHEKFVELITLKSLDPFSQLLGFIGTGAIGTAFVFGYKIFKKLSGPIKETSINVYHRRNVKLEDFLNKAKEQVHIFGIALEETLSGEYTEILKKVKSQDIKQVRILLSNPDNEQLVNSITQLVNTDMTSINGSLSRIRDFKAKLGQEKSKLEIKVFDGIPIQSMFIIDPLSKKGVLRFEPYLYAIQKGKRRIYELPKKKDKELFEACWESYKEMWNNANPAKE